MEFRIFIFLVCVSCFNIVSSYRQYQEFGHEYQQHPDRSIQTNYARNTPVYPAHSQSLNHAGPSHVSHYALHPEPQYVPNHQRESVVEKDPSVYENTVESSAQSQIKSNDVEHKPVVYIPQSHQELPRPYPVDNTFEFHVPAAEHVYRPDYTQHVAKPWVSQSTYQPTVHQEPYHEPLVHQKSYQQPPVQQEPYHQPIVYSEQQPRVYQYPPPLQHAQPQHQSPPQHAQPRNPPPARDAQPQRPPPPQQPTPHQQPPHQQTYYKPQPSYVVPIAHAQAQAYAASETNIADILASKPEVKDYLESALLKHYQLDDLGNSHHVKSSDITLEENDNHLERTTEKPHNNHQNNKHFQKQLLDNDDNQNKNLHVPKKNNHIVNSQTLFEETKHETIPLKNGDSESFYYPRFAYLNHKENPTEVKKFPIEVKPVNPHHYRNTIVKHHLDAKYPDNIIVDEKQKPAVPTSLGNTDDSYPIEPQNSKNYDTSTLKDKEDILYDHDVPAREQHSKKQPEPKQYADKIHPENDYLPIKHSKIPSHSKHTDKIMIDSSMGKAVDASSHGIDKPKDSFDDVTPQLFYSDTIDDTKAPLIVSSNFNSDKPHKEFYSDLKKQPEVVKPTTDINNGDVVSDPIVSQRDDPEKRFVNEIDVTKANEVNGNKQTINENVFDNGDKQQKTESEPRSTLSKDIEKQSHIEGSPQNADSPTDDGTSTEDKNVQNDDCTSGEIDSNINGDDEEADFEDDIKAVLLSSIDLWEKLLLKQPNMEFQAFNVVTLSPIVEKTSRLFAFPNQTTVEESVETVWEHKGDAFPLEIKLTTIIRNPRQKHAFKWDKTEQDKTKCD